MQVVPSTKGLQKGITDALNGGSAQAAGKAWGGNFAGTIKAAIAAAGIGKALSGALNQMGAWEQLEGGVNKIFDTMDTSQIFEDAKNAYKDLNMSANEYLSAINDVGATFSASMGDAKGYETAKRGLQAISDYASGTGKSVNDLGQKFTLISRATSSYQSIADQFSGILPATSADFLQQAQAAGFLADSYKSLTEVPVAEYQEALSLMLEKGTADLGLAGNTAAESASTLTGSLAAMAAAGANFLAGTGSVAVFSETLANAARNVGAAVKSLVLRTSEDLPQLAAELSSAAAAELPALTAAISEAAPKVLQAGMQIVAELGEGMASAFPHLAAAFAQLIPQLADTLVSNIPALTSAAVALIGGLSEGLLAAVPILVAQAPSMIIQFAQALTQSVPELLSAAVAIVDGLTAGLIGALPTLLSQVPVMITTFVGAFTENIDLLVGAAIAIISGLIQGLIQAIPILIEYAPQIIASLVGALVSGAEQLYAAGNTLIVGLADGLLQGFLSLLTLIGTWVDENIVQPLINKAVDLYNAGADLFNELWDGIKSVWDSITTWFSDVWDSLFGNLSVNVDANVSSSGTNRTPLASGLDYVPYDNFPAMLHRGEAVLTSAQAETWRRGAGAGQIIIRQEIYAPAQTPAELAAATAAYFEQARWSL